MKKLIKLGNKPAKFTASAATQFKEEGSLRDPKVNELREEFLWALQQRDPYVYGRQRINF